MQRTKATYSGLLLSLLLTGCAATGCPAVKTYSIPQQQAIAKEWNALPDGSALLSPLDEWEHLRAQLKH